MGKSKSKKKTKTAVVEFTEQKEENQQTGSTSTHAMDGHNVDGWTDSQVAAYNELIIERKKLEKQRKELETKSAKSHAGRALLNEDVTNINSAFKSIRTNGHYQYGGSSLCCVELNSSPPCHHEICSRSRTEGVSHKELEAIKYYAMRIPAEKTERKRDALRKQRDTELIRIRREEDVKRARDVRKSVAHNKSSPSNWTDTVTETVKPATTFEHDILAGATKETQTLVTKILKQLDDLRMDLQAGRISTSDMQKKLDTIDEQMQAAQLKPSKTSSTIVAAPSMSHQDIMSSTKAFQDHIKDRIINTKGNTYSKAFHIMEHFLSASKPGDFQAAVLELKDVLRLSGPMGDELQKSFDALEGRFDSPDRLSFTGPDGKQECSSIIDLMAKMKDTLQRTGELPEGANTELVSVFDECIRLEADGKSQMMKEYQAHTTQGAASDLGNALSKVKNDMVAKSPIPPLTEQKLGDEVQVLLAFPDVESLVLKASEITSHSELDSYITALVMNRALKKPEKFVEVIGRLSAAYGRLRPDLRTPDQNQDIDDALSRVKVKMQVFAAKQAEKKAANESAAAPKINKNPALTTVSKEPTNDEQSEEDYDPMGKLPPDVHEVLEAAVQKFVNQDATGNAHLRLREIIVEQKNLWPLWFAWSNDEAVDDDPELQDKSFDCEDGATSIMNDKSQGLKMAVVYLFQAGICPGMAAGVISQLLADLANINPDQARVHMQQLADCIQGLPKPVTLEWSRLFQHLALAMIQLYVSLNTNAAHLFPSISSLQFGMSVMAMIVSYICLTRSRSGALHNFQLIWTFVNTCMSEDGMKRSKELYEVAKHFLIFCNTPEYRCLTLEPCYTHMASATRPGSDIQLRLPDYLKIDGKSNKSDNGLDTKTKTRNPLSTLQSTIRCNKRHASNDIRSQLPRDLRYADSLKRAAHIHEVTAQKAKKLMQIDIEGWKVKTVVPLDDVIKCAKDRAYLRGAGLIESLQSENLGLTADQSESSEYFHSLQAMNMDSAYGTQMLQRLLEDIKAGTYSLEGGGAELALRIEDDVLGGHWPDPSLRTRRIVDRFTKTTNMPEELRIAMKKVQIEVDAAMGSAVERRLWETSRFRFMLSTVQAEYPTPTALHSLVSNNHRLFEEYCALLAGVRAEQGHSIDEIRNLCSEVLETVGNSVGHFESKCLADLSEIAHQDWSSRYSEINPEDDTSHNKSPMDTNNKGHSDDSSAKGDFVDASSYTKASSSTNVSFKTAASRVSTWSHSSERIAEEQSAQLEHDLHPSSYSVEGSSTNSTDSDVESSELSQTETVTPANALKAQSGANARIKGKGVLRKPRINGTKHHTTPENDPSRSTATATTGSTESPAIVPAREVEMIKQLINLTVSVNNMKHSDEQIKKGVGKSGGISMEEYKTFERVTAAHEQRLMTSRDIAGTIADCKDYEFVKEYLKQGRQFGHLSLRPY